MKIKNADLFDFKQTIASKLFQSYEYPWQLLSCIAEFILNIGEQLPREKYTRLSDDIWVSNSAQISQSASIQGPCIIGENTQLRHCAFIRGAVLVGDDCVIGNSTELKNSIIFNCVQAPHFNYVGDSILGYKVHIGAGCITSNIRSDRADIIINNGNFERHATALKKAGAFLGDYVEVGCNTVLNPGSIVGKNSIIYPLTMVRGCIPCDTIVKQNEQVARR